MFGGVAFFALATATAAVAGILWIAKHVRVTIV